MTLPSQPGHVPPEGTQPTDVESRGSKTPKHKTSIIAGASVLALAVLIGGGYALANGFNSISDKDISQAMPADTAMFAEMDLNPSNGQKLGFISVVNKLNSLSDEETIPADTEPKEFATDIFFEELDYDSEVKPWMGDKVAFGAWGDFSPEQVNDFTTSVDDFGIEAEPQLDIEDPSIVVIYETTDVEKAKESATKALTGEEETVFGTHDDYLVVASTQKALDEYTAGIEKGNLADSDEFQSDRKELGIDAVATGWMDVGKTGIDESDYDSYGNYLGFLGQSNPGKVEGRVVTGLTFHENGASNVTKMIGFDSEHYDSSMLTDAKGLDDIGNLPGNSIAAIGFKGLDEGFKKVWEKGATEPDGASSLEQMNASMEPYGVTLPDDFTRLLGTESNFAFATNATSEAIAEGEPAIVGRLTDADAQLWTNIMGNTMGETVSAVDENGVAVVSYNGHTATGKLSENPAFKETVGDLSQAQVAGFFDLGRMAQVTGEETVDYGSIGINGSHDKENNVSDLTIKWIF